MLSASPWASSLAAAAHRQPRWTSPRAPPLLPPTTMPSALLSLRPRPRTKTRTLAHWWCSKAHALTLLQAVPGKPPQPLRCCQRAAAYALCDATVAALRAAATDATPLPSCRQHCAVALPPPPQHPRCCNRTVAAVLCTAVVLRAATTTADTAAAAMPPPSFRQHRAVALPPHC
jgi:hypothetical protein